MLLIRCLGSFQVGLAGAPLSKLHNWPKHSALLGYLILHRGELLDRSRVAGTFWPDLQEKQARRCLNTYLWRLRRLGKGMLAHSLHTTATTLCYQPCENTRLDIEEFDRLTRETLSCSGDDGCTDLLVLSKLERAAALYTAPLLDGCDSEWVLTPRQRYQERYFLILQTLIKGYEATAPTRALPYARMLVEEEPYYEQAHAIVIRLHLALGQYQDALQAYNRYCKCWKELGLPASSDLRLLLSDDNLVRPVPRNTSHTTLMNFLS